MQYIIFFRNAENKLGVYHFPMEFLETFNYKFESVSQNEQKQILVLQTQSSDKLMSRLENFDLISSLGKGSFGTVLKCIRKSDGQVYAMKQIKLQKLKDKDKKNALNQIRILASIQHPQIISYKDAFYDQPSETLCVVMEYANEGDLEGKVKKCLKIGRRLTEKDIWRVAYQSLLGLAKLHDCNIIHRDIKSANIFFHNGNVKIGDLNVAKHLKDPFTITQTGTPYYASPEVWNEEPYDYKSDIWSLGCVLYEMAMLKSPFKADNTEALYQNITLGLYHKISPIYSIHLADFIGKCLTVDQKRRMTAKQLLSCNAMKALKGNDSFDPMTDDALLSTIDFPKNMKQLNGALPKPKYDSNSGVIRKAQTTKKIEIESDEPSASKKISLHTYKLIGSQRNIQTDSNGKEQSYVKEMKSGNSSVDQRSNHTLRIQINQRLN